MKLTNLYGCLLLASSLPIFANTPIWVKDGAAFTKDGQITLKTNNAGMIGVPLNHPLSGRASSGRTPNIMIVGKGSGVEWGNGILSSDGFYYVYNETLDETLVYSQAEFDKRFTYTLGEELFGWTANVSESSKSTSVSVNGTCGNEAWIDEGNNCSMTYRVNGVVVANSDCYGSYYKSGGRHCSFNDSGGRLIGYADIRPGQTTFNSTARVRARASVSLSLNGSWAQTFGISQISASKTSQLDQDTGWSKASTIVSDSGDCSTRYNPTVAKYYPCHGRTYEAEAEANAYVSVRYYLNNNWNGLGKSFGYISGSEGSFVTNLEGSAYPYRGYVLLNYEGDAHYLWSGGSLIKLTSDGSDDLVLVEGLTGVSGTPRFAVEVTDYSTPPPRFPRPRARFGHGIGRVA